MSAKHTPGPWEVDENPDGLPIVATREGDVAHVRMALSCTADECDANARLIAAAPDLLGALEKIISVAFVECQPDRGDLFGQIDDIARAAIAKAKGETP